jgi:hypothetical protein
MSDDAARGFGIGQPSHLNQPGFHPTPIWKQYGVGIPAELAKHKISVSTLYPLSLTPGSRFSDTPGVFLCWKEFRVLQVKSGEEERPSGYAVNTNSRSSILVTGSEPGLSAPYGC